MSYLRFHLIYKFQCSNCDIPYYDKTKRHLKVRAGENICMSPLTGKRVNSNSFDDFTVLNYESHNFKRLIKEPLLVTKDKPLSNKQVKSLKLELFQFNSTYAVLLYLR